MEIELTRGYVATIDDADWDLVKGYRWNAQVRCYNERTWVYACTVTSENRMWAMHRLLLGLKKGDKTYVDHIDGNTLNNSRSNLRPCKHQENCRNRTVASHSTTGLKGVQTDKNQRGYRARIVVGGRKLSLGTFSSPEEAHAAYWKAAQQYYGEFARKS